MFHYMAAPKFIRSPVSGHLDGFQILVIVNKLQQLFMFRILYYHKILIHLDRYLGLELLGHMVNVNVIVKKKKKPVILFFKVAETFYIPTSNEWW